MPKLAFPAASAFSVRHPFQITFRVKKENPESTTSSFYGAVAYHSQLFKNYKIEDKKLVYSTPSIEITGLGEFEKLEGFPDSEKKYYCILELTIENFQVAEQDAAKIKWVKGSDTDNLAPIEFESTDNLRQTKARVIIAAMVSDKNEVPIDTVTGTEELEKIESQYALQYINTHLLVSTMSINGIAVIYPIPFAGGPIQNNN